MAVLTGDSYLSLLKKSNLLTAAQLATLDCVNAQDARVFARMLVQKGLLTKWQAQQLLAGRHAFFLGKYKLLEKLGEGGMGTVFTAQQSGGMGRTVALKVMAKELMEKPSPPRRFLREVKAAAVLNHPNIVKAFDADCSGKIYFLVMEHVPGQDLNVWINQFGSLPVDWSCECIRQAALGLQHAHEKGLVHRDIKPSNLLVVSEDTQKLPLVKILDMGLARFMVADGDDEQSDDITTTGEVLGSFDYVSPEQAENAHNADIRSDIFSLGCTLFHLLTGSVPFAGRSAVEKLMARATDAAPSLSSIVVRTPPALDVILTRMMAREPDRRYQTPQEVADALKPFSLSALDDDEGSSLQLSTGAYTPDVELEPATDDSAAVNEFLGQLQSTIRADTASGGVTRKETQSSEPTFAQPPGQPHAVTIDRRVLLAGAGIGGFLLCLVLFLGWQSFRNSGPKGTVQVLVNQPHADVSIDGGAIQVKSPPVREPVAIIVSEGTHGLTVSKAGYETFRTTFSVKAGGEQRITASLVPIGSP